MKTMLPATAAAIAPSRRRQARTNAAVGDTTPKSFGLAVVYDVVVVDELQTAARAVVRVLRNDPGADGAGPRVPGHEMRLPAARAT